MMATPRHSYVTFAIKPYFLRNNILTAPYFINSKTNILNPIVLLPSDLELGTIRSFFGIDSMKKYRRTSYESPRQRRSLTGSLRDVCMYVLITAVLVIMLVYPYLPIDTVTQKLLTHIVEQNPIPHATNRTYIEGVGFVLLGLGSFARQLKCEAAMESLRNHGGWDGSIFLLTDAPSCFKDGEMWKDCRLDAQVVDVGDDLSSSFAVPSLTKTRGNRLRSKKYKTRIFEHISDPSIEVLIYMDCDMLIAGAENGIESFILDYISQFNEENRVFLFPENSPEKIEGVVHGGIFMAHRKWSAPVLQKWGEQLDTEIDASDQAAFVRAGIMEYQFMDHLKYLLRPRCDLHDCSKFPPLLFNHINGARCWNQGKDAIQRFVDRWELCTYRSHEYCYPWYMTQFAMSWVPYTSCTKMEARSSHT